jgi:dipeptidyl aminopeptidase/acylaminoacyl peptidase
MLSGDFKKFKSVSDPQISPDGKRILFTVTTVNEKEDGYDSHIWEVSSSGGKPKQFTFGSGRDSNSLWSPDGKNILFLSSRGKEKGVLPWVISAEGGEARLICSESKRIEKPVWSPDGKNILFLARVRADEKPKSDVKVIRKLVYKANAVGFFHDSRFHLFVAGIDGGKSKQLTQGEFDVVSADWSPNGTDITFVANMTDEQDYTLIKDVWVISSKGGKPKKLTNGKWQIDSVSWSPDGKRVAFLGREIPSEKFIVQKNPKLWIMSSEGGAAVNVTDSFDEWIVPFHSCIPGWSEPPTWDPDSNNLYFKANEKGTLHIYKVSIKDHKVRKVTDGKMNVGSFSLSRDGSKMAFDASESIRLSEVWIHDEKVDRRLTDINGPILKGMKVSSPEEFWFTASDGIKIQGWIMKPVGFREGRKYPTILEIHGGPYGAFGYSFSHEFQVFASNGFAVVYTNPRSSLGYGEKFSAQAGHWGERDYVDIMEAVDYVEKTFPFVDSKRLGVTGGSYGGYMTNWIVGHTDRFKAAIAERSISNWYSFHGAGDIGAMPWLPTHDIGLGKNPWDALELYFEKSPISYVKNVKTPLMIITSDEDWDCTIDQSEQMFVALKKLKKEVELIIFPGENHNLSRTGKPGHRVERYEHMLRWFNKYLK